MNEGNLIEKRIIKRINNKRIGELDVHFKNIIFTIFKSNAYLVNRVYARKLNNNEKADIEIETNNIKRYISIKSGNSISVHQEGVISFMIFLNSIGVSKETIKTLLYYHYGDNTLKGDGEKRYDASYLKLHYKDEIAKANNELNNKRFLKEILYRVLVKGENCKHSVEYFYYGDENIGYLVATENIISRLLAYRSYYLQTPHFSSLTFQPYGRDLKFKDDSKRKFIQVKWKNIFDDISKCKSYSNLKDSNNKSLNILYH